MLSSLAKEEKMSPLVFLIPFGWQSLFLWSGGSCTQSHLYTISWYVFLRNKFKLSSFTKLEKLSPALALCPVCSDLLQALYISVCHMHHVLAQLIRCQVLKTIMSFIFMFCQGQACCCSSAYQGYVFHKASGKMLQCFKKGDKQVNWMPPGKVKI